MIFSVYIAMSLDGFIARRDHSLDFLDLVAAPNEDYGYAAFKASIDVMVMGRGTYDAVMRLVPTWPFANERVIVLTHRPLIAPRADEQAFAGPLSTLKASLAAQGLSRAYLDGGQVVQQALDADLVDELTVSIVPIRLGDGISLFGTGVERRFSLLDARSFPSGLAQLRYRRA